LYFFIFSVYLLQSTISGTSKSRKP